RKLRHGCRQASSTRLPSRRVAILTPPPTNLNSQNNYSSIQQKAGKQSDLPPGLAHPLFCYFALMVTVNVLLGVFVSVPLTDASPVELKMPGAGTLKLTVTIMVCPAATVEALQMMAPPPPTGGVVHAPAEAEKELKGNPGGSVAMKTTAF